ncbi:MAG TPA: CheR family methyltransferase [Polyangiales bacterium]|nr:CheR family methyltransferase [Polyangiales bacterium]
MNDQEDSEAVEASEDAAASPSEPAPGGLPELLSHLREARGFDCSGYKEAGLVRRLTKRVKVLGLATFHEYLDYLQVHPDEFANLFNSILINATSFFRDPSAWEFLAEQVMPRILSAKRDASLVRIWSAGCATGQEAYTVAMMVADAIGVDACTRRVKIYATDVDDDALNLARQATYTSREVATIPSEQLRTYFDRSGVRYAFQKELRRCVIFGRHNLLYDAPISKIDLLLCRNTLMYFNADAQARILSNLHFALNGSGVLLLGKAEMLLTHSSLFIPLDLRRRLFNKVPHAFSSRRSQLSSAVPREQENGAPMECTRLRAVSFDTSPLAQLALDAQGVLAAANEQARRILGIAPSDLGRPIHDLPAYRKLDDLSTSIQQANFERRSVGLPVSEWTRNNESTLYFDIVVSPIVDGDGSLLGTQISLTDVSIARRMQEELQQSTTELEAAHEELQSTSEELETTNEELQSTIEELETTNEELQSTNEELETTNEELQSTNEELHGMNEELRIRSHDLSRLNLYFESILAGVYSAVIVLDRELHVQVWSPRAAALWGLRADEVRGKHLLNLDIGLPVQTLSTAIRACLTGEREFSEVSVPATNRRGKPIVCAVKLSRFTQDENMHGVIMLMDEVEAAPSPPSSSTGA